MPPTRSPPTLAFQYSGIGIRSKTSSVAYRLRMKASATKPAAKPTTMYGTSSKGLTSS